MNNHAELQELCTTAFHAAQAFFHAAQVAFMLTDAVKVVRCYLDEPNGVGAPDAPTSRIDKPEST